MQSRNYGLHFRDAYIDGEYLFFSADNFNGLFRYKKGEGKAELLGYFSEYPSYKKNLHRQVVDIDEKLYFIPYEGKGIDIYDKNTGKLSFVKIQRDGMNELQISRAFVMENDIVMVPSDIKIPFIIFRTKENTYELRRYFQGKIMDYFHGFETVHFALYSSCILEKKLYLAVSDSNVILCINLEDEQVSVVELKKNYRIRNMCICEKDLYLTMTDMYTVVKLDTDINKCDEYEIKNTWNEDGLPFVTVFQWKDHLLLLPNRADDILELDKEKKEWCKKSKYIPEDFCRVTRARSLFLGYQCTDDTLWLFPNAGNGMICVTGGKGKLYKIDYSEEKLEEIWVRYIKDQSLEGDELYENGEDGIDLKHMISALLQTARKKTQTKIRRWEADKNLWLKLKI